ncbi:MAG TPA: hypothetical protein VNH11_01610 [Pirellulales bacterium]|nr:hypothetical protein [Pirellulales bacterium]
MTGLRDGRERLRQGIVRIRGSKFEHAYRQEPLRGEVTQFYAFDYDALLLRYERAEPRRSFVPTEAKPGDKPSMPRIGVTPTEDLVTNRIYYRRPGLSVQYMTGGNKIAINAEDASRPICSAFDVRAVGLLYLQSYHRQNTFEEIFESFNRYAADELVDEGNGVFRVQWTIGTGDSFPHHRRTLWIDRAKGFSPIRLELREHPYGVPPTEPWGEPYCKSEATWAEVSGVWVPETFRISDGPDDPNRDAAHRMSSRFEHKFEWESVNELLPDALFEVDSLNPPEGCLVVDWRGQRPVVERVIGAPNSPIVGELPSRTREQPPPPVAGLTKWFFIVNVILLAAVALVVGLRMLTRRAGRRG